MAYPLPAFNFIVEIDGLTSIAFSEVSGLGAVVDVLEYREGGSHESSPIKMPGLVKYHNVTLKRGIVKGNNEFYNWFNSSRLKTDKRNVVISLLDEERNTVVRWLLENAFPAKIEYTGLNALANEIALEELELAYERLSVDVIN